MSDPREIVKVVYCATIQGAGEVQEAFKCGPDELMATFYGELPPTMDGEPVRITVEKITWPEAHEWMEKLIESRTVDGVCYFRRGDEPIGQCHRDGVEHQMGLCQQCQEGLDRVIAKQRKRPKHETPVMVADDWGDLFGGVKK
jgi:hypothetical protein